MRLKRTVNLVPQNDAHGGAIYRAGNPVRKKSSQDLVTDCPVIDTFADFYNGSCIVRKRDAWQL